MQIEWWYWIVAGVTLILAELAIPMFVLVWFGLSALLVGVMLALLPTISFAAQLTLWLVLSIPLVVLWFKVFKPGQHKTRVGMSESNIVGEIGLLVDPVAPFIKGTVRFQRPFLGSDVWACISTQEISSGVRVRVLKVEGSLLNVEKESGE